MMENSNNKPKSAESKDYDVENPQELNIPKFNSTSEKRESHKLPYVENVDDTEQSVGNDQQTMNDSALFGDTHETNLGNNVEDTGDAKQENDSLNDDDPGHDPQPRKHKDTDDEERIISR
jgi:hypothetical protein